MDQLLELLVTAVTAGRRGRRPPPPPPGFKFGAEIGPGLVTLNQSVSKNTRTRDLVHDNYCRATGAAAPVGPPGLRPQAGPERRCGAGPDRRPGRGAGPGRARAGEPPSQRDFHRIRSTHGQRCGSATNLIKGSSLERIYLPSGWHIDSESRASSRRVTPGKCRRWVTKREIS
jgi:hypothetical protein